MSAQDTTDHEPMAADEQQEAVAEIVREDRRVEQRGGAARPSRKVGAYSTTR